jgi:uncharacterized protein YbaP (TraB family)
MKLFHRTLLLTSLLLCSPVLAHPAIWQVKRGDSTVYLFGTVHLLPNDTAWRFPALNEALAKSQSLYIELTDDDQANMAALVLSQGMDIAHPLSTLLSQSDNDALVKAAQLAGVPGGAASLQPMRPWLAALTLAVAPLMKAGLDPAAGVDKQLQAQMTRAGKPVHGLETAAQQIHFLADLPDALQLAFLRDTLHDVGKDKTELLSLVDAWKRGDVAAIAKLENDELKTQEPALYQKLLVQRNQDWAARIKDLLRQPGTTVLVAVGAAHLAGPDSVQAQLAKIGVTAQQD